MVLRSIRIGLALVALVALFGASACGASSGTKSYDSAEECIDARPIDVPVMSWRCVSGDGARWTGQSSRSPGSSMALTFAVLALVWAGVPLALAVGFARMNGESVLLAVVATLLLGWIGLAIVFFGQRRSAQTVASALGVAPVAGAENADGSAEDRLRLLERLREERLVTAAEYDEQRRRIITSL